MTSRPTPFLPPQVATLLKANRKIEAIKLVIDSNPGLGLRDAKEAVEAYQQQLWSGQAPVSAAPARVAQASSSVGRFPEAAREALRQGQTVTAIKIVREAYGLGLGEAKRLVESYAQIGDAALAGIEPGAGAAVGDLPADVAALVLAGDRPRAAQLLHAKYGFSAQDATARVGQAQLARKPRGPIGDSGRTVAPGDRSGGVWLAVVVAGIAAAAVWYFVSG